MSATEPGRRGRHITAGGEVFRAAAEFRGLSDGYAFRPPADSDVLFKTAVLRKLYSDALTRAEYVPCFSPATARNSEAKG